MSRHPQWEPRLVDFIAANVARPYKYGQHDCLLFAANAVKAVTGKDHGRGHRGKYKNAASASRYLRGLGFGSPEELLDSLFDEKPVGFAQRGDLVLAGDGIAAVCMGAFALSVGQDPSASSGQAPSTSSGQARDGLVSIPRSDWVKAWRVGG